MVTEVAIAAYTVKGSKVEYIEYSDELSLKMSKTVDLKPFEQKNANSQLLKILLKSPNIRKRQHGRDC
jgi:hypothetical protein